VTKARFMAERREAWKEMEALLRKLDSVAPRLTGDEVSAFSLHLRSIAGDLATVRTRDWGRDLERRLNDLVTRAHNAFYRSPPGRARNVLAFLASGFPRLFRQNIGYFLVSLALFAVPLVAGGILVGTEPARASRVLPAEVLEQFDQMYSSKPGEGPADRSGNAAGMAGFYVHNNIGIAFRCFATGIFLGAGTIFFLVYNGIVIGTVTGYVAALGHGEKFFGFVVSHGSFELTAIVISGAAGLILGRAIVHPGPYDRWDALRRRGLDSVRLCAGAGAMLAVAALVEAFWSPLPLPLAVKLAVGGLLWLAVVAYLALAGRGAAGERSAR
jgi:uncharacterized membrane protein SpoIIM required for sporulation